MHTAHSRILAKIKLTPREGSRDADSTKEARSEGQAGGRN
jgi:hypothetical protein